MLGTQTVTVTYGGHLVTFDVTVEPFEPTLTLMTPPDKTTYLVGETLDTTGLSLMYRNRYGMMQVVTEGFECSLQALHMIGVQTVTVTYEGLQVTFDVTVEPHELTLALLSAPDKTSYFYGEILDMTGLSLLYTDEFGDAITVTEGYVCDLDMASALGTQTVTVTYENLTVTFDVTVEPLEPTLTLLTMPDQTTYAAGETLDMTGLTLGYTDEYGALTVITEGFVCTPETFRALGLQTVTVSYGALSVTFDVTVEPLEPTLTLQFAPDKTSYLVGDTIDTTGMTLLYTDEVGDALVVTEGFLCDPEVFRTAGEQTVTVTYNGLSVTFDVTVQQTGVFLVTDAIGRAGETVDVAVRISNNHGIVAAWIELEYDSDVLTLVGVENGGISADGDFTPCNDLSQMPFRVLFLDALGDNHTQDGDLVVFTFRVRTDARPGESVIDLTYDAENTYDVDMENVPFETQAGTFTVRRMPGDVNADGLIDLKDAVMIRRYLAGWDVTVNLANADVDQKEGVNLKDVTCICRYLAGGYEQILL